MDGLNEVDADLWRDVRDLQAHWIGSCDGVRFEFQLMVYSPIGFFYYLHYTVQWMNEYLSFYIANLVDLLLFDWFIIDFIASLSLFFSEGLTF